MSVSEIEANGAVLLSSWKSVQKALGSYPATQYLLTALLFGIAVAYVPGVLSVGIVGRWALITVVGLPALLIAVEHFNWSLFETRVGVFLLAWVGLSLTWSVSPWDTLGSGLHWLALAGLFVLAASSRDLTSVWVAFALGVSVSLPFVILQSLGYEPVWSYVHMGFSGIGGLFLGSNTLAEASTLALILVLAQGRWVWGVAPALCAVMSGRKEVAFMLAAAGILWLVLEHKPLRKIQDNSAAAWLGILTFVGVMITSGLITTVAVLVALKLGVASDTTPAAEVWLSSSVQRIDIWADTLSKLSLFGTGLGTYGLVFPLYSFAHDDALQLEFELGIGSLPFFWVIGNAFRAEVTRERVALAALCASALVWAPLQDPTTAAIAVVLTGYCCGVCIRARVVELDRGAEDLHHFEYAEYVSPDTLRQVMGNSEVVPTR